MSADHTAQRPGRWVKGRWVEDPVPSHGSYGPAHSQAPAPADVLSDLTTGTPAPTPGVSPAGSGGGWWLGMPRRYEIGGYLALLAAGFFMRLWDLGSRAIHHDESLHAYFSWELYTGKGFQHNPLMHGPFQFHGMAGIFWLLGDSEFTARLLPVLFGSAMILLPLLLRRRLGNVGALITAGLITISPALLYYSRFAREDIYMGFWTLALVGLIWRYIDDPRNRWLYLLSGVVALGFATKENEFMIVAIVGLGLVLIARADIGRWIWGQRSLREWGPAGSVALVLGLLTLPLIGAAAGVFQSYLPADIKLTAPDGFPGGAVGAPRGAGYAIAIAIVVSLLIASIGIGLAWRRGPWLKILLVFWAIYITLHTTFFTNMIGVGSGTWQALGYWIAQQDVARGSQPWYYYFVIVPIYEFLPFTIAVGAAFFYAIKGDIFTRFLILWAVLTFIAYTIASEKMPWLVVHVALPMIVLAGKALGDVVTRVNWRATMTRGGIYVFLGLPLALLMVWRVLFFRWDASNQLGSFSLIWAMCLVIAVLLALFYWLARRTSARAVWSTALVVATVLMGVLTVRAGVVAAYAHGDVPREMLVYTQTSPDIPDLMEEINRVGVLTGEREKMKITVDAADGYTWPWAWYLRKYKNTGYPDYSANRPTTAPDSRVVIANYRAKVNVDPILGTLYTDGRKLVHRWWFPEQYRDLTPSEFFGTVIDPDRWHGAVDYFLFRKLSHDLGGVDSYVYFERTIPLQAGQ